MSLFSQREGYEPSPIQRILWWLSTRKEILVDSVVDRNRYRIIGMTVLATWPLPVLYGPIFFSTVVDSLVLAVALGLFMGFIILTIDQALIKGITKFNKKNLPWCFSGHYWPSPSAHLPAQPAVLYMFDKEIKMQTSLDNEKRENGEKAWTGLVFTATVKWIAGWKTTIQSRLHQNMRMWKRPAIIFLPKQTGAAVQVK